MILRRFIGSIHPCGCTHLGPSGNQTHQHQVSLLACRVDVFLHYFTQPVDILPQTDFGMTEIAGSLGHTYANN